MIATLIYYYFVAKDSTALHPNEKTALKATTSSFADFEDYFSG
jgi:hypothetical protein